MTEDAPHSTGASASESSTQVAKKRFALNLGTNGVVIVVSIGIQLWQVPYLLERLGIAAYGLVPLALSCISYFELATKAIADSVSRYVAVSYGRNDIQAANRYLSSATAALVAFALLVLPLVAWASAHAELIFRVPAENVSDARWLFFLVLTSALVTSSSSPFLVSTLVTHRFDLRNALDVLRRAVRVGCLVGAYIIFAPSLAAFGLSYVIMAVIWLFGSLLLLRRLTPRLRVSLRDVRGGAIREMSGMSMWAMLNQVGSLLYLNTGLIIINLLLGPEACGRFGPPHTLAQLLLVIGVAASNLFTPLAFDAVARKHKQDLVRQLRRATRYLSLAIALPVGLICGLARPLLTVWVGPEFSDLGPLAALSVAPWLISVGVMPMYAVHRGLDRVRAPALATLGGGVLNIACSIALVVWASWGLYGVAAALFAAAVLKNGVFVPWYTARITDQPRQVFLLDLLPAIGMAALIAIAAWLTTLAREPASLTELGALGIVFTLAYGVAVYVWLLDAADRALVRQVLRMPFRV